MSIKLGCPLRINFPRKMDIMRKGIKVSELRKLFEEGITVRSIFEPLRACSANESAAEIKRKMLALDFDVFGLNSLESGPVEGYIQLSDLKNGTCGQYKKDFNISDVISNSTSLIDALTLLRGQERIFVLVRNSIEGIITRADLQKPPVRLLIFGLITLIEMHLSDLIRKYYPGESWRKRLSPKRMKVIEDIRKQRKKRNEELDDIDCLQFCDKRTLALDEKQIIKILDFKSKKQGNKVLRSIEKIRDKLFHAQDIVIGTTWEEIISLIEEIESLIQKSEASAESKIT